MSDFDLGELLRERFTGTAEEKCPPSTRLLMGLLPAMQHLLAGVQSRLAEMAEELSANDHGQFPYRELMLYALRWPTSYWKECAVGWILEGYPLDSALVEAVDGCIRRKEMSQKVRHKVGPLLNRWRRSQPADS